MSAQMLEQSELPVYFMAYHTALVRAGLFIVTAL